MAVPSYDIVDLALTRRARIGAPAYRLEISRLALPSGARLGLVGESGVGKSTLLDLLALIRPPETIGRFGFLGQDLASPLLRGAMGQITRIRRRGISYILQDGGLLPYLSIGANARLAQRLAGAHPGATIQDMAAHLGIAQLLGKRPSALSGGQRQRAAVLRGLASGAPIILADEPTAALDRANAQATLQLLANLPKDRTVIVSSHQEDLLAAAGFTICRLSVIEASPQLLRVGIQRAAG